MNPAPRKIDNFKTEKPEMVDFSLIGIICLNVKGGAG